MRLALTLMVRDEIDVVGAMLDHHLAQGVDVVIVTDNGSVDGTAELLQGYADRGLIELRHDPVHRKQQASLVTAMARAAAADFGADWVINADADEFWLPEAAGLTLKQAFEGIPAEVRTFQASVDDMVGPPASEGTGLQRLVYRDHRPLEVINELGIHAHPTPDAPHVGTADVEVVQGNHYTNLEQGAPVPAGFEVEVLHFPWRSWRQFSTKVRNAGEAYERSGLTPSPNHHGMRDYRRLLGGTLFPLYLARHPDAQEMADAAAGGLVFDDRVARSIPSPVADVPFEDADEVARLRTVGRTIAATESTLARTERRLAETQRLLDEERELAVRRQADYDELANRFNALSRRPVVRAADSAARLLHRG